ncbi:MAG: tRNA epoxyqueuosine(34) reductase QueG [Candidatus Methylacidiphilales bacterium]|nr:tRNA epoxyqueuosine(34) reductase QueG [Candidatus Methylacidiphilales bacterium]
MNLGEQLKVLAAGEGFDHCAVASVETLEYGGYFLRWLEEGKQGSMAWLARDPLRRLDPAQVQPGARSVVMLALNYYQDPLPGRGRMARYALGRDYHDLMLPRLERLASWMEELGGRQRVYVDTGPVLEKVWAARAGLAWQGKSTMAIHPRSGTWFFLGTLLTTLAFPPDPPMKDHCGSCTRCIDACPTGAIHAPYQLDARRCIAYLTIEHPGDIPEEFRSLIGDRVYGCDDCLEVCPWNRWARATQEAGFQERPRPDLAEMLDWKPEDFDHHFRGSPVRRLKLPRWKRNLCVVLGNIGTMSDLPALERAAAGDDPMVARHARWAVEKLRTQDRS